MTEVSSWRNEPEGAVGVTRQEGEAMATDDVLRVDPLVTAQHHLAWLVDFSRRDLSTSAAKQQADNEVIGFCREWYYRRFPSGPGSMMMLGFDATLDARRLQPIAKACVAFLEEPDAKQRRRWFHFENCPVRFGLSWADDGNLVMMTEAQSAEGNFTVALVSLLEVLRERLRRCSRCGRLFTAARPAQRFCTKRCQNAATSAAYRATHPAKVSDARHGRHAKAQEKRVGHKVKVARRPRKPH